MKAKVNRILTGHRPTGPRHIGHLVGTLERWAELQNEYDAYFLVADPHITPMPLKEAVQRSLQRNPLGFI